MNRLVLPGAASGRCVVEGPPAHHLLHVLRSCPGEPVEVTDGAGSRFPGIIERFEGDTVVLVLGEGRTEPPLRRIDIVQGLPKGDKLDLVLQKCTELGASTFSIALCARTVVKVTGKEAHKQARWQRVAAEAARQCGRADVPEVPPPRPLEAAVAALPPGTHVFVLDEEERATLLSAAFSVVRATSDAVALVVGPEGGLERAEVRALAAKGAISVTLGRLVLRTETAALAALAVLRHLDGALG